MVPFTNYDLGSYMKNDLKVLGIFFQNTYNKLKKELEMET
jgi:hypothetical protein